MKIKATSCASKRAYFTKDAVNRALREMRHKPDAPNLNYYRCPDCGNYHLTKMSPADYHERQTKKSRYMLEKVDGRLSKKKLRSRAVAQVAGVTAVVTTFQLLDDDDGDTVYDVRIFTGDPMNGPYHSARTAVYYSRQGALFESVGIAAAMGANVTDWMTAVGLNGITVTRGNYAAS